MVNNNACLQILASVVAWSKASSLSVLAKCKSPLSDSNQRSWHYKCHALNHLAKWAERLLNRQVWEVIMARLCNGEPLPSTLHLLSSTRPRLLASPRKHLRHGVSHYGSFASSPPATSDVTPWTLAGGPGSRRRRAVMGIARTRLQEERKSWRKDHPHVRKRALPPSRAPPRDLLACPCAPLQGFVAKPSSLPDGTQDILNWEVIIPGKDKTIWAGACIPMTM